jgi:hypothetical protein
VTRKRRYPSWLFTGLGVLALLAGLAEGAVTASFLASAEKAEGVIVDIRNIKAGYGRGHRKPRAFPEVRFQDPSGRSWELLPEQGGGFHTWSIGQRVELGFPPGKPREARILGFWNQWTGTLMFVFGGIALVAWGRSRAAADQSPPS